jgi:large subunit ribosomal protein L3
MLTQVFATKRKMTQAWTKTGKRLAVTCFNVTPNLVIAEKTQDDQKTLQIGYGKKKLKNMAKPLRSQLEKGGFSLGAAHVTQVNVSSEDTIKAGESIKLDAVLQVGDVVKVQGVTKGRGFAGAMKRHNFQGGPKTHGQSDRWRAVGSIGQRTTPGRVMKGKRMPGRYGTDVQTVAGLVVLHINPATQELWLSGPVPGFINSMVRITKTGETKQIELDTKASNIIVAAPVEAVPAAEAATPAQVEGEAHAA